MAPTRRRGQVPHDLEQLLRETASRCYNQAVLREGEIRVEDWVHFGLLSVAAPSPLAHHLVNERLRRELAKNPFVLKEILGAFEEADVRGAGILRASDVAMTFIGGEEL